MNYKDLVDKEVKKAILKGFKSFEKICENTHGVFPTDVYESLQRLKEQKFFDIKILKNLETDISYSLFPEPHPIDFEWRFTSDTAISIAKLANRLGNNIACIGTPTVFYELLKQNSNPVLVDRNINLRNFLEEYYNVADKIYLKDLLVDEINIDNQDVFVVDPPWYLEDYKVWLSQILKVANINSKILITIFPELLRDTSLTERKQLLDILKSIGSVQFIKEFKVFYETPLFERETLNYLELPPLENWRNTDLILLTVNNKVLNTDITQSQNTAWERFQFGPQIVTIKKSENESVSEISVKSPYEDGSYILKSISSRDPVRKRINFWTSRNRALVLTGEKKLTNILRLLQKDKNPKRIMNKINLTKDEKESLKIILSLIGF